MATSVRPPARPDLLGVPPSEGEPVPTFVAWELDKAVLPTLQDPERAETSRLDSVEVATESRDG
jgi:hypothetical protein